MRDLEKLPSQTPLEQIEQNEYEDTLRDEELEHEANELAREARDAYEDNKRKQGQKLFIEALDRNNERTDLYRFHQALDIFLDFRTFDREYTDFHLDILRNRYDPDSDSFERTTFARNLMSYALEVRDFALIDVAESLIDDDYIYISILIQASKKEKDDDVAISHVRQAKLILETIPVTPFNERRIKRNHKLIDELLAERGSCYP